MKHSRENLVTDFVGRGADTRKSQLSHWSAADNLRGSSGGHCQHCRAGYQVWQCGYIER